MMKGSAVYCRRRCSVVWMPEPSAMGRIDVENIELFQTFNSPTSTEPKQTYCQLLSFLYLQSKVEEKMQKRNGKSGKFSAFYSCRSACSWSFVAWEHLVLGRLGWLWLIQSKSPCQVCLSWVPGFGSGHPLPITSLEWDSSKLCFIVWVGCARGQVGGVVVVVVGRWPGALWTSAQLKGRTEVLPV